MLLGDQDRRLLAAIHRWQRLEGRPGPAAALGRAWAKAAHTFWTVVSASDIARDARIARSARFPHLTGVVIHRHAVVEEDCLIMQGVTLGTIRGGAPRVCRGAYLGAGAKVLGPVTIGEGARIGANAVVLEDVPAHATAVGIPARVVRSRAPGEARPAAAEDL